MSGWRALAAASALASRMKREKYEIVKPAKENQQHQEVYSRYEEEWQKQGALAE